MRLCRGGHLGDSQFLSVPDLYLMSVTLSSTKCQMGYLNPAMAAPAGVLYTPVMAKADRLARLDERRIELEAEYRAALIAALEAAAGGRLGLFGHSDDRWSREAAAPALETLEDLAATIDDHRDRLSLEPFTLHREFLAARGPVGPSAVGERKQAKAWLERLAATE